ncbi:MAG: tetratricopeptide repeat protein, partial [Victivallales bacterium]|nr:tetratricopeptide repeat protein [Victivallales bacterium]
MNSKKIFVFFLIVLSTFIPVCIYASEDDISTEKYYTANALYNKKLYKLAAEEFRNFLIRYPEHPKVNNAKLGLGLSYYELKKYSEAKPIFSELADKQNVPYQDQIHNLLGQCYLIENNPSQAEAAFRWSINSGKEKLYLDLPGVSRKSEESPQVPMGDIQSLEPLERSYAGLIEALFQQKKWEDVINYAKELKKNVPNSKYEDRVNFLSGLACYQLKKYAEAEKNLKPIVRKGVKIPFYAHALFLLAECQQHLGKLNDSAKNHEIIVKRVKGKFTDNSLFRLAYINYLQKNYNSAIRDFSDLRSIFPDSPYNSEAGIYLGKCFYKIKDYTKAQSVFGTLMDNKEVGAEAHLWLGKVFEEKEDYEKAIDVLTAGTKKYKDNPLRPKLMFELANAKMLAKDYTEAGSLLDKINRQYPENEIDNDSLKFQAFCYNRAGLYKKSNRACSLYLKKYPQSKEAVDIAFLKAENLFFQDKLDKAVKEFKKFIPVTGKEKYTYEAIYRLAQCYAEQKKWKHAYNETDTLIRNNIKGEFYNQLYYIAGISAYELGNWSKAIDYLKEYITVNTEYNNTDSALMKLALSYIKVNDYGNAEVILNKLIKTYPESRFMPYALNEAGKVYFKKNKFKKADKYFDRIIAQYPESEFVQQAEYYLGWIAFKESDEAEAAEYFKKISEKYPNSKLAGNSLLQLAVHQMRSGKYEKAEENLNKYLTVYSKDNKKKVEPLYYLYYCRSMNKKYDDIEDIFEPFIKKYPKSKFVPTAIYESAWRAKKLGNEKLAEKYYKEFLKKFPGHKLYNKVLFELAEDNYNRKEYDKAINKLDKLKASDLKPEL